MDAQIFDILKNEINVRVDKQWKIFSWTSTVLISIAAGIITLESKADLGFKITLLDRSTLTIIILTLTIYARQWIKQNIEIEEIVRIKIADLLQFPEMNAFGPGKMSIGYVFIVFVLSLAALSAVWIKFFFC